MCMKENLIYSRTCVYNINYHVVWSVKYRRKILSAEIEIYLKELVQKIACDKGFTVHLFEVGEGDHIHCFVSAPPKLSVTDIVKYLKGNYICLFDYLFISSQMSAKPYFIGSTGILLLW